MPNKPAIPLVTPRQDLLNTHLPAHEQAARGRRRTTETPRHGTARTQSQCKTQPRSQPPLNPFPTPGPDFRTHQLAL